MRSRIAVASLATCVVAAGLLAQGLAAESEPGLIVRLKFDEKKGNVANDSSGAGHNAEIRDAKWAQGKFGSALEFDGSDSCVVVTNLAGLAQKEITISVWQKANEVKQQHVFCLSPDDGTDRVNAHTPWEDEQVYWDFGNISDGGRLSYTPAKPIVGTWQHFVFVASQSANFMKIYRNGALEASDEAAKPGYSGAVKDLFIGSGADGQLPFAGLIGEFRIYNRALNETEIKALHKEKTDVYKD